MAQPEIETKESDLVIIVITVLIFAIFVVGLASVCYRWSSRQFYQLEQSVNPFADSVDGFITVMRSTRRNTEARGINAAIVKSFPTFLYLEVKERKIGKGGVECAVCLCEFQDDETLRLMPNCCHVFHADCVSVWLSDHSTCPLCRVDIVFRPCEESNPDHEQSVLDSTDEHLVDGVTWTNRNRPPRSWSTRLSHCRISEILFSRSHSTGHCVVQPVESVDRFTIRLPIDVRRKLTKKTMGHVALTQVRSSRLGYRSRSAGSERSLFSYQRNNYINRRLHSMTFSSFPDCVGSTSGDGDAVAPIDLGERLFEQLELSDRV
ncbi:hypothetical protein EUTSA_v10017962mg [Eutrema salsugineum]|uniref:RING-type E3 ubiquitin transferase n=1 Tax=Eutrema salsugineum TaxID=72664 RepID=V4MHT8_EUTSA|nr:RING-H2 finger protein ATL38 [Eutrema salsugineum]ESQ52108.1 hypothetical protein EUTSA_v10017962mg [Eutrema salsugineum]